MRINLLFAVILTVALFSTVDTNGQTTMYSDSQPMSSGDPFQIERVATYWAHCKGESSGGDKIYRAYTTTGGYTTSKPNTSLGSDCEHIEFSPFARNGSYGFGYGPADSYGNFGTHGTYVINQDNNLLVTLADGNQLLVLTDQLMEGILTVREVSK